MRLPSYNPIEPARICPPPTSKRPSAMNACPLQNRSQPGSDGSVVNIVGLAGSQRREVPPHGGLTVSLCQIPKHHLASREQVHVDRDGRPSDNAAPLTGKLGGIVIDDGNRRHRRITQRGSACGRAQRRLELLTQKNSFVQSPCARKNAVCMMKPKGFEFDGRLIDAA